MAQQRKRTRAKVSDAPSKSRRTRSAPGEAPVRSERIRRPTSSGPPTLVIIGGLLIGILVLLWAFKNEADSSAGAQVFINAARRVMADGDTTIAVENKLSRALADPKLTTAERNDIDKVRKELAVRDIEIALKKHNMVGTEYLQKMLMNYADIHLSGDPDHPKARVFMERCKEFRKKYPQHPNMDWVDRNEGRFSKMVNLNIPPTWADMEWKVKRLVNGDPKEYGQVFEALDSFMLTASAEDKMLAQNRRKAMVVERDAHHINCMQQARFELDVNKDKAKCVQNLLYGVLSMGDPDLALEAAEYLLRLDNPVGILRGYQIVQPLKWERLMQDPTIGAFVRSQPDF